MKKKVFYHRIATFVTLASISVLSGCVAIVAAGAGAGTYAYLRGSLESHLPVSLETAIPAVNYAMDGMGLVKVRKVSDLKSARFTYRDTMDTRIVISLSEKQKDLTAIKILVGRLGDESRSLEILRNINAEL